jgi:hypothetical protein
MTQDIDLDLFDPEVTIGLGDEDRNKVPRRAQWYKGEKGRTDRVAIVFFPSVEASARRQALRSNPNMSVAEQRGLLSKVRKGRAEKLGKPVEGLNPADLLDTREVRFRTFQAAYHKDVGFVEIPSDIPAAEQAVWRKLGEPRSYVSTLLLVYQADRDGDVDRRYAARGWRIVPWRFAPMQYEVIRKIDKGLREGNSSVAQVDLSITCIDTQYQKVTIAQAGPAIYRQDQEFTQKVLATAAPLYDQLKPFRTLTTDELREKLGMPPAATASGSMLDGPDFGEVLATL